MERKLQQQASLRNAEPRIPEFGNRSWRIWQVSPSTFSTNWPNTTPIGCRQSLHLSSTRRFRRGPGKRLPRQKSDAQSRDAEDPRRATLLQTTPQPRRNSRSYSRRLRRGRTTSSCTAFWSVPSRPGETFALRWEDIEPGRIRIDERVYRNELGDPKTETSNGYVAIPTSLELELALWKQQCKLDRAQRFVFFSGTPSREPMDGRSYLHGHR